MAKGYPDYEGGKSGLYLKPEWAAFEGEDITLEGSTPLPVAWGVNLTVNYLVPGGMTLYITDISWQSVADAALDADKNRLCMCWIYDMIGIIQTNWFYSSGNGGGNASFSKPIVIPAGHRINLYVRNDANFDCNIRIAGWGYEI